MPICVYKKVHKLKNGDVKIYEYNKDTSPYSKKAYHNKRGDKIKCEICGRLIFEYYMEKHKNRKICSAVTIQVPAPVVENPPLTAV